MTLRTALGRTVLLSSWAAVSLVGCARESAREDAGVEGGVSPASAAQRSPAATDPVESYAGSSSHQVPAWALLPWTVDVHLPMQPSNLIEVGATKGQRLRMPEGSGWECVLQPVEPKPLREGGRAPLPGEPVDTWHIHRRLNCSADGWQHRTALLANVVLDVATRRPATKVDHQELYLEEGTSRLAVVLRNPWR